MADFLERIAEAEARSREIETQLSDPKVGKESGAIEKLGRRLGSLRPLVAAGARYRAALEELADSKRMLDDDDPDMVELARSEIARLDAVIAALELELRILLTPKDPNDEKNAIFEIRAGTGGDEAALFAAELYRMYSRYAEGRRWKIETLSYSETDGGGLKEIIAKFEGQDVFSRLKYEKGVHRVQRVPATESQGRIHTSTVTVAVHARSGRGRHRDQARGSAHRRHAGGWTGWAEREHDGLGGADHASAVGARGPVPGREVAAQEQGEGVDGAAQRGSSTSSSSASIRSAPGSAVPRWAPASAARRSAPTTSPRAASPITAPA